MKTYPLAGHAGACNKVQVAASTGSLTGRCDCGFSQTERKQRHMTRITALALALTVYAAPASAQVYLHTLEHALVKAFANEFAIDQKGTGNPPQPTWNDPVKLRFGAFAPTNYYGAISGDRLLNDATNPTRHEKILIALKEDAEFSGEARRPMIQFQVQRAADTYEDADMRKVLTLTGDYALFHRPIYAPNLNGGESGPPAYLQAGAYQLHLQAGDGNFVLYEMVSSTMCPRWALIWLGSYYWNGTGLVDPAALAPPCN